MIIEFYNHITDIKRVKANRVVIYDDDGKPIAAVIPVMSRTLKLVRVGDPDFESTLAFFGIDNPPEVVQAKKSEVIDKFKSQLRV